MSYEIRFKNANGITDKFVKYMRIHGNSFDRWQDAFVVAKQCNLRDWIVVSNECTEYLVPNFSWGWMVD